MLVIINANPTDDLGIPTDAYGMLSLSRTLATLCVTTFSALIFHGLDSFAKFAFAFMSAVAVETSTESDVTSRRTFAHIPSSIGAMEAGMACILVAACSADGRRAFFTMLVLAVILVFL